MGKKIFYILISLFAFSFCITVKAETRACTDEEIRTARASLSHEQAIAVSIPSLGRTSSAGRAYFYKMKLTNKNNNTVFNSFCLDSAKPSRNNTIYKIDREVTDNKWKKAYQYAITYKNDNLRYITAQSAIWLLRGTNGLSYSEENLKKVSRDVYINLNCESLMQFYGGMSAATATSTCERAKASDDSTDQIQTALFNAYQNRNHGMGITNFISSLYSAIDGTVLDYIGFNNNYSGKLYWWVAEDNKDYYQGMLAPLNCDGNTTDRLYCTDSNGNKHYYANDSEYNQCIQSGGNETVCKSNFDLKYCNGGDTGKKYIVKRTGNDAVCTNYTSNIGTYYEYVEESNEGTAIPGKGEPEKVINSYCNLYCLENIAQQVFPGNVRPAVSAGTYIIWPTSESTLSSKYKNKYPLSFMGQKTCYVVMSGNESTVNNTNINTVYNSLVNNIRNGYDGTFARRSYESSRVNGGCDNIYSNSNGACKSSYDAVTRARQNLTNFENSEAYQNALREQQEINSQNNNICEHDYCSEVDYFCTDSATNIASVSCPIITEQCRAQRESGCHTGSRRNLSSGSQNAFNEHQRLQSEFNRLNQTYESCQNQKNIARYISSLSGGFIGNIRSWCAFWKNVQILIIRVLN